MVNLYMYKLFDKRDQFPFFIVRMAHILSKLFVIMLNSGGNTTLINKQITKAASRHTEAFFTMAYDSNIVTLTPQIN